MRVLVLGGYGLIGAALVRALGAAGHEVLASGRSAASAARVLPGIPFRKADLAELVSAPGWAPVLEGVEAVVNAAGALQDGARDDLAAVHHRAIAALAEAAPAAGVRRIVQISAPGAAPDAPSAFLRTKGEGDAALRAGKTDWVILRPGLVVGPQAYGGTALLRMLAAMPLATPLVHADTPVQCVALDDVADAVLRALGDEVTAGTDAELVEPEPRSLRRTVAAFRRWLGYRPAPAPDLPPWIGRAVGRAADGLGRLGWRSPLRSTAMDEIARGVTADPGQWPRPLKSLGETLAAMPATVQERRFARGMLMLPVAVGVLALFWLLSGLIGLARLPAAAAVLDGTMPEASAKAFVILGSLADIALGTLILIRRFARAACVGMVLVTLGYLAAGTVLTPWLWADPLGPFLKTLPAAVLALVTWTMLEER